MTKINKKSRFSFGEKRLNSFSFLYASRGLAQLDDVGSKA